MSCVGSRSPSRLKKVRALCALSLSLFSSLLFSSLLFPPLPSRKSIAGAGTTSFIFPEGTLGKGGGLFSRPRTRKEGRGTEEGAAVCSMRGNAPPNRRLAQLVC